MSEGSVNESVWLRGLVAAAIALQLSWFFIPQIEYSWMTQDAIVLSAYAGLDAYIEFGSSFSYLNLILTIAILILIAVLGRKMRYIALAYFLLSIVCVVPIAGMNVESGLSMAIRDLLGVCQGAILLMLFMAKPRYSDRKSI